MMKKGKKNICLEKKVKWQIWCWLAIVWFSDSLWLLYLPKTKHPSYPLSPKQNKPYFAFFWYICLVLTPQRLCLRILYKPMVVFLIYVCANWVFPHNHPIERNCVNLNKSYVRWSSMYWCHLYEISLSLTNKLPSRIYL